MRALIIGVVLAAGCYAPTPPSGAYLCGASSNDMGECPSNQHCQHGQCVDKDSDAVYSLSINVASLPDAGVTEHQPFPVTVNALDESGKVLPSFSGDVTLSSTWGDVCVGTSGCVNNPGTVHLTNGTAMATVQLNRETNPPQTAILRATYAAAVGSSGATQIVVNKPVAQPDGKPIAAPIDSTTSYGFARYAFGAPFVVKSGSTWTLYYEGGDTTGTGLGAKYAQGVGLATSPDGITFTPQSTPLFTATAGVSATNFGVVCAYVNRDPLNMDASRVSLFFGLASLSGAYTQIERSDATSIMGPFSESGTVALSIPSGYSTIDNPVVIPDPSPSLSGGGADSAVMYFSAATAASPPVVQILRAVATDGTHFVADASPMLEATTDEALIIGPRILVDQHTYKMWYSYVNGTAAYGTTKFGCEPLVHWNIGYATSSDGYFWIRSSSNVSKPTLTGAPSSGTSPSLLMGSVVATDGVDPSNGIALYYSPMQNITIGLTPTCLPNGIDRAVLSGSP